MSEEEEKIRMQLKLLMASIPENEKELLKKILGLEKINSRSSRPNQTQTVSRILEYIKEDFKK